MKWNMLYSSRNTACFRGGRIWHGINEFLLNSSFSSPPMLGLSFFRSAGEEIRFFAKSCGWCNPSKILGRIAPAPGLVQSVQESWTDCTTRNFSQKI